MCIAFVGDKYNLQTHGRWTFLSGSWGNPTLAWSWGGRQRVPEASVRTEVARNAFAQDSQIECTGNFGCKALEFKAKIPLQEYKKTLKEKLPKRDHGL